MRETTRSARIGFLGTLIILAAVFTAAVHVDLGVSPTSPEPQLRGLFALAALGFLGTLAAMYAPLRFLDRFRWLSRLGLLGVTVATIAGYVVVMGFTFDVRAIVDKAVDGFLVLALVLDGVRSLARRERSQAEEGRGEAERRAAA
jgi:hypothetical protein